MSMGGGGRERERERKRELAIGGMILRLLSLAEGVSMAYSGGAGGAAAAGGASLSSRCIQRSATAPGGPTTSRLLRRAFREAKTRSPREQLLIGVIRENFIVVWVGGWVGGGGLDSTDVHTPPHASYWASRFRQILSLPGIIECFKWLTWRGGWWMGGGWSCVLVGVGFSVIARCSSAARFPGRFHDARRRAFREVEG